MTPTEANFDGERGICLNNPTMLEGGIFKLRRGAGRAPSGSCKNQLIWYTPKDTEPKLLYCDDHDNWYELSFTPIGRL